MWFSGKVEEYDDKDCWFKSWHIFYLTGECLILICIKCILNDTNLNNSFKIHHIKKRKKHFHQCTRGDSHHPPQQLSAGAIAAQIYTQICWVFPLAPTNMLRVSIGAHRQVIFVPSSTNLDKYIPSVFRSNKLCEICVTHNLTDPYRALQYILIKKITPMSLLL